MIMIGSLLQRGDNSGIKYMRCVRVPGGSYKRYARMGHLIKVALKYLKNRRKLQKKKVYTALIIGLRRKQSRNDGSFIKFDNNRAVLLSDKNKFIGSRIVGPLCKEMRGGKNEMRYKKIISRAHGTV